MHTLPQEDVRTELSGAPDAPTKAIVDKFLTATLVILGILQYTLLPFVLLTVLLINFKQELPNLESYHDWGSFYESGRAANEGLNPYGVYPLSNSGIVLGREVPGANMNPPLLLPLFQLAARTDIDRSFRAWFVLSLLMYLVSMAILIFAFPGQTNPINWFVVLAFAGLEQTLENGQVYSFLLLSIAAAFVLMHRNRPLAAGVLIGVVIAVKPMFILWPITMWLAGQRRVAYMALTFALLGTAFPLLIYSPQIYLQWLTALSDVHVELMTNLSLLNVTRMLGIAPIGLPVSVLLSCIVGLWAIFRRPSFIQASSVAIATSALVAPWIPLGYSVFLLPAFLTEGWSFSLFVIALMLSAPPGVVYGSSGGWFIYPLAILLFVATKVFDRGFLKGLLIGLLAHFPTCFTPVRTGIETGENRASS